MGGLGPGTKDQMPELTHECKAFSKDTGLSSTGLKMGAAQTTVLLPRQVWGNSKGVCGEGSPPCPGLRIWAQPAGPKTPGNLSPTHLPPPPGLS